MPATKLTRRELLRWSAGSLLAAGLWPGTLGAEPAAGDFHFLVVNDIHYQDERCGKWFEGVVKRMKSHKEKPAFCLVVGDLVEKGKPEELTPIRELLKSLGMPFHAVIGNHDYLKQDDRKAYEEHFPDRLNYHFAHEGWQFVGLDSSEGLKYAKTNIQPATLKWLDEQLPKLDKKKPTIVFTHFPLGPTVTNRPLNADDVLTRLKEFNLQAVYGGHFHGFTERKLGGTVLTTNRCCSFSKGNHDGTKEKGYFLCHARDGKIERAFVEV